MRGRKRRRGNLEEEAQWKQQNDIGDCSDLWRQRWRQRLNNDIIRTRTRLLVRSRSGSIDDGNGGNGGSGGSGNCIGGRSSGRSD